MSNEKVIEFVKQYLNGKFEGYSSSTLSNLKIKEISSESLKCSLIITKEISNHFGFLHGGCISTLADDITTAIIILADKEHRPGVTISLTMECRFPAKIGEEITISVSKPKTGKSIAFSECIFTNNQDNIIAKVQHIKYLVSSKA